MTGKKRAGEEQLEESPKKKAASLKKKAASPRMQPANPAVKRRTLTAAKMISAT